MGIGALKVAKIGRRSHWKRPTLATELRKSCESGKHRRALALEKANIGWAHALKVASLGIGAQRVANIEEHMLWKWPA